MKLHELTPAPGSKKKRKRVGRGPGSGHGKTACKGSKGQKSRSGYSRKAGFEGGQMPLQRRLPKRGFANIFRKEYTIVNVSRLEKFFPDTHVTPELMIENGLVCKLRDGIKVLGDGSLSKPLKVSAHRFSRTARGKIEAAGGSVEVLARSSGPRVRPEAP